MSEDQFCQLRDDIAALRCESTGRLSAIEARLDNIEKSKPDSGDVFQSIVLANAALVAIIGIVATTLRTFGVV